MKKKTSPNIYEIIYDITRQIPFGRVTSFGAIARCIGTGASARMVGWALGVSQQLGDVPAHRVVNRNGLLTGKHHFGANQEMQHLLEKEGIEVKNDQIVDFETLFWDPLSLLEGE